MIRNRNFTLLWFVNIVTTLALELFTVTILVTIFEQTSSTLQAAGTMVARTLPAFLLSPIAGVLVDRFPRKNVLIAMDVIRLGLVGMVIPFLRSEGDVPVAGIYLILAGLAAAGVFHNPARLALIPSLVESNQLVRANSFILVTSQIILAISYTVGGWLIQIVPLRQIAFSVICLFALAVITALLIKAPKRRATSEDEETETFWQSVVSGWRYLRGHPVAKPLTIMETIEHVPHGIWTGALMLTFTVNALGGNTVDWGYQVTGYFTGMIVGALGAMAINDWLTRYPGRIIVASACSAGIFTFIFAGSPTVLVAVAIAFLFGPPFAIRDVAQDALLQGTVDNNQLGRVYSTREALRSAVFMVAGIFFAWLSEHFPIRPIYFIGGFIYLLTGIYALSNKSLRESHMNPDPATND